MKPETYGSFPIPVIFTLASSKHWGIGVRRLPCQFLFLLLVSLVVNTDNVATGKLTLWSVIAIRFSLVSLSITSTAFRFSQTMYLSRISRMMTFFMPAMPRIWPIPPWPLTSCDARPIFPAITWRIPPWPIWPTVISPPPRHIGGVIGNIGRYVIVLHLSSLIPTAPMAAPAPVRPSWTVAHFSPFRRTLKALDLHAVGLPLTPIVRAHASSVPSCPSPCRRSRSPRPQRPPPSHGQWLPSPSPKVPGFPPKLRCQLNAPSANQANRSHMRFYHRERVLAATKATIQMNLAPWYREENKGWYAHCFHNNIQPLWRWIEGRTWCNYLLSMDTYL